MRSFGAKRIYLRLGKCDGAVPCVDLSSPGIDMDWMENGSPTNSSFLGFEKWLYALIPSTSIV